LECLVRTKMCQEKKKGRVQPRRERTTTMQVVMTRKRYPSASFRRTMGAIGSFDPRGLAQHDATDHRAAGNRECTFSTCYERAVRVDRCLTISPTERPSSLFSSLEIGWDLGTGHGSLVQTDASVNGPERRAQCRRHRQANPSKPVPSEASSVGLMREKNLGTQTASVG
jgi:hypothetical protein